MIKSMKSIAAIMLTAAMILVAGCKPEDEPNNGGGNSGNDDSDVRVTTYTPQDITQTTAVCGGDVIVAQGLSLNEFGVCWSTESNPTASDDHRSTTNWNEPFVCTITSLEPGTEYHVRAYALRGLEYYYGEEVSFQTEETIPIYTIEVLADPSDYGEVTGGGTYEQGQQCTVTAIVHENYSFVNWTENGEVVSSEKSYTFTVTGDRSLIANFDHAYVDLGLPSGTLWATCNVGADTPEGYGDYFAWGETQPKTTYNWSTYQYCNGDYYQLTKYCNNSIYGYNGFTDNLTVLQTNDDAATTNWGEAWCMPTADQWRELRDNTIYVWTTQNGVNGRLFTASNGHTLFLPAAGSRWDDELKYAGYYGHYWSSSLDTDTPFGAWYFHLSSNVAYVDRSVRRDGGNSVRAVREN